MTEAAADPALRAFLAASSLVPPGCQPVFAPLTGGVASDIWRVEAGGRRFVVKRALAKLRVEQDWRVPTGRNAAEVAWLQCAGALVPGSVPRVLAHDPQAGLFAMTYLDPASHPVWKAELAAGRADPAFAAAAGRVMAALHAGTSHRPELERRFANQALFRAIRVDPYLLECGRRHPALAPALDALGRSLLASRVALVHGDVSPKNILCAPHGPVLLDAECACCGDPAFDAAFCLNHLLLKCLWRPDARPALLACFDALAAAWLGGANWEERSGLERRAARLLPALLLARVDGKSPVEYLDEGARAAVRRFAPGAILAGHDRLADLRDLWVKSVCNAASA